jgi:hypothetical protein
MRSIAVLLLVTAALAGCTREVTRPKVAEFIDHADEAARKRFAPEICKLRGKDFSLHQVFHGYEGRAATEMDVSRALYCQQAGKFSRLRQYRLERKSMDIDVAADRKTARVDATYVETLPYYEPDTMPSTPDDFYKFQVLETRDESVVGLQDGRLVFLSTRSESHQQLVGKNTLQLPYD